MTRAKTMTDNQYHDLRFSDWIRERCPDSATGWTCSDVDYVLHQYKTKQLALLEVKRWRHGPSRGQVQTAQRHILRILDNCIRLGMRELYKDYTYHGVWLVQFDRTWFDDGLCWFTYDKRVDAVQVTEDQLLTLLSLEWDGHVKNQIGLPSHPCRLPTQSLEGKNQKGRNDP